MAKEAKFIILVCENPQKAADTLEANGFSGKIFNVLKPKPATGVRIPRDKLENFLAVLGLSLNDIQCVGDTEFFSNELWVIKTKKRPTRLTAEELFSDLDDNEIAGKNQTPGQSLSEQLADEIDAEDAEKVGPAASKIAEPTIDRVKQAFIQSLVSARLIEEKKRLDTNEAQIDGLVGEIIAIARDEAQSACMLDLMAHEKTLIIRKVEEEFGKLQELGARLRGRVEKKAFAIVFDTPQGTRELCYAPQMEPFVIDGENKNNIGLPADIRVALAGLVARQQLADAVALLTSQFGG